MPLVEQTNALSISDFIAKYIPDPENQTSKQNNPSQQNTPTPVVDIYSAATISTPDLEACLDLVEQTSSEAYIASSAGWSRTKKRKEMKLPDMKYLIVRGESVQNDKPSPKPDAGTDHPGSSARDVLGFLSFMVTYEDGKEVVYCYEIHLSPTARGRGVGRLLMGRMEGIGRAVGLEKSMLTVFKSNEVARGFYETLGYGIDEYSPRPRKLRNGTIKEADYLILSKALK
jgi:ribosomal protein S18 acetylase RimI-like enzyme